jgi:cobalt-zinc-cadmium efflux system outer membrane protein
LLQELRRALEAGRAVTAADVALAEVENQATRQQVEVAMQDYANALTDLRNQMGVPETAGTAEPLGEFILPGNIPEVEDQALIQIALQSRPDLHAARAACDGAAAAVRLAKGDRIPTPIVGPVYQNDEVGVQYIGFVYITPLPFLNSGKPLVIQRQAEYCRALGALQAAEQRAATQVKAAAAKWNAANRLIGQTGGLTEGLKAQVGKLDRLFQENQASLAQLLQARQRLIQLENAELDALWQATQAQSDLLLALGAPYLIAALHQTEAKALVTAHASDGAKPGPKPSADTPAPPGPTRPSLTPR